MTVKPTIRDLPIDISSVVKLQLPITGGYELNYLHDIDNLLCLVELNGNDETVSKLLVFGRKLNKAGAVHSTSETHWDCVYGAEVNKETFGQYHLNNGMLFYANIPFISFQRGNKTWAHIMINDNQPKVQRPNKLITSSTMPAKDIIFLAGMLGLELVYQEDDKLVFNRYKDLLPGNRPIFQQQPQHGWQGAFSEQQPWFDPSQRNGNSFSQQHQVNINLVVNLIQEEPAA